MNQFLSTMKSGITNFARDEEGAQIVEYALIIALVSIAMAIALAAMGGGALTAFVLRVTTCLAARTTAACSSA